MKQEYIIVNKTKLLERIEILNKQAEEYRKEGKFDTALIREGMSSQLNAVISYSTPLEPIVSDALTNGINIASLSSTVLEGNEKYSAEVKYDEKDIIYYKQEYINNFKLEFIPELAEIYYNQTFKQ